MALTRRAYDDGSVLTPLVVLTRPPTSANMQPAFETTSPTRAQVVIDVTNITETDPAATQDFFAITTGHLLDAEQRAGVGHHVVLSIVGVDRVESNGHYAGKRTQEQVAEGGPVPATILRATQFHDFAGMVVGWTRQGEVATVPPLLVQPVAVSDLADVLAEIATGAPQGRATDLAGPDLHDLVDMLVQSSIGASSGVAGRTGLQPSRTGAALPRRDGTWCVRPGRTPSREEPSGARKRGRWFISIMTVIERIRGEGARQA